MHAASPALAPETLEQFDTTSGSLLERSVFNHRKAVMLACAIVTVLLAIVAATRLTLSASFEKMIPRSHPYIQNYLENRSELRGLGNALRIVVAETQMPHRFVWDVVEGFALDADGWGPRHESDLYRYCYHVAGAVGCMMAIVMGVDPSDEDTLDRAADLGLAFQLANIARDI